MKINEMYTNTCYVTMILKFYAFMNLDKISKYDHIGSSYHV